MVAESINYPPKDGYWKFGGKGGGVGVSKARILKRKYDDSQGDVNNQK